VASTCPPRLLSAQFRNRTAAKKEAGSLSYASVAVLPGDSIRAFLCPTFLKGRDAPEHKETPYWDAAMANLLENGMGS
jgi:hypothetical protein